MSLGSELPYCWLCKNFSHQEKYCILHKIYIPTEKGYAICKDFLDIDHADYADYPEKHEWFLKFKHNKLIGHEDLYIYQEYSEYEEYIPFSELKKKDGDSE